MIASPGLDVTDQLGKAIKSFLEAPKDRSLSRDQRDQRDRLLSAIYLAQSEAVARLPERFLPIDTNRAMGALAAWVIAWHGPHAAADEIANWRAEALIFRNELANHLLRRDIRRRTRERLERETRMESLWDD